MLTLTKSPLCSTLFAATLVLNLFTSAADQNQLSTTNDSVISRIFKSPYTYHALAPTALCTSYILADLSIKAMNDLEKLPVPLAATLLPVWAAGIMTAYYGPSYALTNLMRKYRSSISPEEAKPSEWHYAGIGLIQGSIIFGFLMSHDFKQKNTDFLSTISSALFAACFLNPGIIAGVASLGDEDQAKKRMLSFAQVRQTEAHSQMVAGAISRETYCKRKIYEPCALSRSINSVEDITKSFWFRPSLGQMYRNAHERAGTYN